MLLTWGAALLVLQYGYDSAAPAEAASVSPGERARMETVIRDYLLSHPEIIPEAVKRLQERQVSDVIETNREAIETPFEGRSEEHTSELQSLMRISYAVFCLKK